MSLNAVNKTQDDIFKIHININLIYKTLAFLWFSFGPRSTFVHRQPCSAGEYLHETLMFMFDPITRAVTYNKGT